MNTGFSDAEGRVLHGLLEDASGDIVVRVDAAGFVIHASANAEALGIDLTSMLLMPHIADFAVREFSAEVSRYTARVLAGQTRGGWIEFPVRVCAPVGEKEHECAPARCLRWFALSLRLVDDPDGAPQGAMGLIRSVQHKRELEGELNARALTDPLTGLNNRHAFCASLRRRLNSADQHAVAVLAIDRMRAIFMQYGQQTADEIQWGFARYLQAMADGDREGDKEGGLEVAQIDPERFGIILPGMSLRAARGWTEEVIHTLSGLAIPSSPRAPQLSASAGLARVETSVDWTLRQAELGLVMARAGGGMQIAICGQGPDDPARRLA